MFFLPADAEPDVLTQWIVPHNVGRPDIVSPCRVPILVVQSNVISVERRWCRLNRSGRRRIVRDTCGQAGEANKPDND